MMMMPLNSKLLVLEKYCFYCLFVLSSLVVYFIVNMFCPFDYISLDVGILHSHTAFEYWMIILSLWVTLGMIYISLNYRMEVKDFYKFKFLGCILALLSCFVYVFLSDNFFLFYMGFEMSLMPTLYIIVAWGYQPERLNASIYFIMYTIVGSVPLLYMLIMLKSMTKSWYTMSYNLIELNLDLNYLFVMFMLTGFLIKVPMWGVHSWLPKAHVEAPVSGSMVLAGMLLKLGGMGIIKVAPFINMNMSSVLCLLSSINLWAILVISFVCLTLVDIKSLIAYTSIIHMALMTIALLNGSEIGKLGGMLMMISHGLSSPMMFALAYINYYNSNSRNLLMHKGLNSVNPSLVMFWFLALAGNMAAPTSLNLVAEIIISFALVKLSLLIILLIGMNTFMSGAYNLYVYSAMLGNNLKVNMPMSSAEKLVMMSNVIPMYLLFLALNSMVFY